MYEKNELCEKIRSLYPELGHCGIDLAVDYDDMEKSWVVYINRGNYQVKHFLPNEDADVCMLGQRCVGLGLEIAQFRN